MARQDFFKTGQIAYSTQLISNVVRHTGILYQFKTIVLRRKE